MLKICLYIKENYFGSIMSDVVPRKGEDILYKGKCYYVKNVFYDTHKVNIDADIPTVSLIGLELEIRGKEESK